MIAIKSKIGLIILGNDSTGKGHIIRAMFNESGKTEKRVRSLACGENKFSGYVFIRSYQELEKNQYGDDVEKCFTNNNSEWYQKDFLIIPSHVDSTCYSDIQNITRTLNQKGFNIIGCYILMNADDMRNYSEILSKEYWYQKIEILNQFTNNDWESQTTNIGQILTKILCNGLSV